MNPRPKLLLQFRVDIGSLSPKSSKTIRFHVISFDEGTIEISQLIKYQTNDTGSSEIPQKKDSMMPPHDGNNQNVNFEYIDDTIIKSKKTTITIPCSAEFIFSGKFYSLDRKPLIQAYKNEDFLFRAELGIKSVDIDLLDMFLLSVSKYILYCVKSSEH